ncbi:MAG: tRNA pseudouridine(13) synthase TruD [Candidatus Methanoplasma sp.]|jgi:tRNA pseudouridine13 synthase|nr:tRNA pseudouridine(13) synthase TruD [Candidatus Methanoplasma sp.]
MTSYRKCDTGEAEIGMLYYLSSSDGTGGRLKTEPEDFIVDEVSVRPEPKEGGKFVIATVTSRNWETNRLVRLLSREIGISREKIGFAGTKDKRGVTTQLMSFECPMDSMSRIDLKDVEVKDAYVGRRGIQIGDLVGNSFCIRVRDCSAPAEETGAILESVDADIREAGGFPNYFGVQRFGVIRPVTHKVGEMLVRGRIEEAVRCYLSAPSKLEDEEVTGIRNELADSDDWGGIAERMPNSMSFEKTLVYHLAESPGDWTGAIGSMPRNLQMMFVHAYQSLLFNRMLSERIRRGIPLNEPVIGDTVIPVDRDGIPAHESPVTTNKGNLDLVARQVRSKRAYVTASLFGSDGTSSDGEPGDIERGVIEKEGVSERDFMIPGLSNCSSKGSRREIVCPVKDLSYGISDDGYTASFTLPKGNYATCLMREFMKSEMNRY